MTPDAAGPVEAVLLHGSLWRRNPPGKEVVRVERAWLMDGELVVRAHPVRGGRPLVASVEHLREHYTEDRADPADYGPVTPDGGDPEDTTCRTCGRVATDHSAGRFSIYGVCP